MKTLLNLKNLYAAFGMMLILVSCEPNEDHVAETDITATNAMATITPADLEGEWRLSAMNTDTVVDLNSDGVFNSNILLETDCFADMGVVFSPGGNMTTTNAKLDFKSGVSNNDFECLSGRTDTGLWDVENQNEEERLIITMTIDGDTHTHKRVLERTTNTFAFEIHKLESQQYYGNPDGTDAQDVTVLSLEYTRVN
ncbi:lipocalin family protein [Salegentibacter sp. LM13S]|uniref:lipocalin family protein n=1 Tax=Salegentibacter lacus TaxID=2873599 RepID=UPI001CC8F789|nr:lipocalin family protein [Salegentibacter lacus]MBZ9629980.1 lipocalin family protein [Salegentibacter lacus]